MRNNSHRSSILSRRKKCNTKKYWKWSIRSFTVFQLISRNWCFFISRFVFWLSDFYSLTFQFIFWLSLLPFYFLTASFYDSGEDASLHSAGYISPTSDNVVNELQGLSLEEQDRQKAEWSAELAKVRTITLFPSSSRTLNSWDCGIRLFKNLEDTRSISVLASSKVDVLVSDMHMFLFRRIDRWYCRHCTSYRCCYYFRRRSRRKCARESTQCEINKVGLQSDAKF